MSMRKRFPLSPTLVVLDIAGALLVARGAWLSVHDADGIWHILAGLLLMVPLAVQIINLKTGREKSGSRGG